MFYEFKRCEIFRQKKDDENYCMFKMREYK